MMDRTKWSGVLLFLTLLTTFSAKTQTNITWQVLSNTQISGTTLSKVSSTSRGYANSANVLYGFNGTNDFEGKVSYTVPNDAEEKTIGFSIYGGADPEFGQIDYGIGITPAIAGSRVTPGRLYFFSPGSGTTNTSYVANDEISIERSGNKIIYKKNDVVMREVVTNHLDGLVVTAELSSSTASFTGVQVDFTSTLHGFAPLISQSSKNIRFTGDAGLTFKWADGDDGSNITKGMKGTYPVVITDANDNRVDRVYTLGAATPWTDLYNARLTGTTLSVNGTYASGAAKSGTTYLSGDNAWVEYVVKYQSDPKAFGLLNSTVTITSYTHLNAGFYIYKSTEPSVQVIVNGSIVKKLICRENDVLKIAKRSGNYYWYINGIEVYTAVPTSYSYKVGGWVGKLATLADVHEGKEVLESSYLTPSYDEAKDNGTIAVSLSAITGLDGPFNHFISDTRVIPMTSAFSEINADFGGTLNQADFLSGNDASTSVNYNELDMGSYVVSSFDDNGYRIFGSKQTVLGDFSLQNSSGITVTNGSISGASTASYGTLNLQLHDRAIPESYIEILLESLSAKQAYGFGNDGVIIDAYDDMQFGFYLEDEKLYLIEEGVIPATYFVVEPGMRLKMVINDGEASYLLNDRPIGAASFSRLEFMTFGVVGHLFGRIRTLGGLSKTPTRNIRYTVSANDCDQFLANLQLTLPVTFGARTMSYAVQLKDPSGANVGSLNQTTFTNLPVGIYTLTGTATSSYSGSSSFVYTVSFPVYVGVKYTSQTSEHVLEGTNGNNVLGATTISLPATDGESVGVNVLPNATDGWISFRPTTISTGANQFNSILLTENPQLNTLSASADDINIRFSSTSNYFYYNNPTSQSSIQMNYWMTERPITVRRQGNTAYIDNGQHSLMLATGFTTARCKPSFVVKRSNVGFTDVVTSMRCPKEGDVYGHLKYELDGYYHVMKKGFVKFVFDQEYNTDDLRFNIYNYRDELVKTETNYPTITTTNGANYIEIDVRTSGGCIGRGFFYIEVINSKKERMYMRFFNDFTNAHCNDYVAPGEPNLPNE